MAHGILFSETMAGAFALGTTDPEAGRDKGRREDTTLAMNANVSIADLDRFIADPEHPGDLSGTVDFAPLGTGLVATAGIFNLFSPTDDPGLKYMVYELAVEAGGVPYYVAGHKRVRNDRGIDMWSDTTTLFTTLHEGSGSDGQVVGAGVLTLGVVDLADLLSTVRVTGTDSPAQQAVAVTRFGRFFMGELWDSYGPELLTSVSGQQSA